MNIKKYATILLIFILAFSLLTACGGESGGKAEKNPAGKNDAPQNQDSGESPEVYEYIYPEDMNGGGADFTFLSPTTTWFFYTDVVFDEMTGDVLDDSIYIRNRFIEDKFNVNIKTVEKDIGEIQNQLKKVISAGSDEYDAAFCPAYCGGNIGAMLTSGMFYNLREIPAVKLGEKWWNQIMLKEAAIGRGDKIYYAGCDVNIMTLQCVSCVYFNQDMMTNLGLELPYNAAREGRWTFDMFGEYMKAGADLNGADNWKWDKSGNAIYGLTSYEDSATALLEGSGERFITTDAEGMPHLSIDGERFINVLTKISEMLNLEDGTYLYANDIASGNHCEPIFSSGRALMMLGELKAADVYKEMENTFGIVPVPKYDEAQKDYYSHLMYQAPVLVIPASNTKPDFTGALLDALAYVSSRDVTPVLFDVSVSQKRLRNEDSIDMLQIIKVSGSFEIGCAYGWTNTFYDSIRTEVGKGKKFDVVSQIDKNKNKIISNIEKTVELF